MTEQSNVETIKGAYAAFAEGDVDAILARLDDDVEWTVPTVLPHGGDFHGRDDAARFFAGVMEKWDGIEVRVDDIVAERDRVVVLGRAQGRLRSAGDAGYGFVHAWTLRDGRAVRFEEYVDPAELLALA
ncbi:MAG TPA: nuclear transport factor 2 family protein [Solirubrobacteraceae bacterium]|nr:nuclear transport factor 2 family protein [Solirubrobacteraceae bacterium]